MRGSECGGPFAPEGAGRPESVHKDKGGGPPVMGFKEEWRVGQGCAGFGSGPATEARIGLAGAGGVWTCLPFGMIPECPLKGTSGVVWMHLAVQSCGKRAVPHAPFLLSLPCSSGLTCIVPVSSLRHPS